MSAPSPESAPAPPARRVSSAPALRPDPGRARATYAAFKSFLNVCSRSYFRLRVEDSACVPASGPCLILANHASFLDPVFLGVAVPREAHFLARTGVTEAPVMSILCKLFNTHGIRRGGIDREAIKLCVEILVKGWPLVIYPEGTRSPDGRVARPKGGFGMILEHAPETPCVPAHIRGSWDAFHRGLWIPRPVAVSVKFGPAFRVGPRAAEEPRRDYYERCASRLEAAWREMGMLDA